VSLPVSILQSYPEMAKAAVPVPLEGADQDPAQKTWRPLESVLDWIRGFCTLSAYKAREGTLGGDVGADAPGGEPRDDLHDCRGRVVDLAEVQGYVGRFSRVFVEMFDVYLPIIRNRPCGSPDRGLPLMII
jgi:hypothetical protein